MHTQTGVRARTATCGIVTVLAALAVLPVSSPVSAQSNQAPTDTSAAPATQTQPTAGAPEELTEVQVTGTRIVRQGYEAPTPVTAVGLQNLQDINAPTIGNALNNLPVFQGTTTVANTSLSDNEGAQVLLDLRNLTAQRTLVLFDGRRLPAANQENVPDVSLIPEALVQRVDVVTGGASAVYGSDAVAGVVNYILDTNFTGVKGEVQGGISGYDDGQSDKISLTGGTTFFDDRLHVVVSADQEYQKAVPGTARPWNVSGRSAFQNPAYKAGSTAPQYLAGYCCVSTPGLSPGGVVLNTTLQGMDFGVGGTVGQYQNGFGLTSPGSYQTGGDYQQSAFQGASSILASVASQHYFARAGFDLTPSTQLYAEFMAGSDHSIDQCCYDYYQTGIGTLYTNNPFLPQSALTAMNAAGITKFTLGDTLRFPSSYGINGGLGVNDFRDTDVYVVGARGKLELGSKSYDWNVYGQQGINVLNFHIENESIKTNLSDAIEAVTVGDYGGTTAYTAPSSLGGATTALPYTAVNFPNPLGLATGTITCASNLLATTNPSHTTNCAPFNVFGLGADGRSLASTAAINYTQAQAHLREVGTQSILGGSITGEPFSDWAGPISVALDAEFRHESDYGFNDPISQQTGYFSTNFFPYFGSQHVAEGAVETVVPLLKDAPFAKELDLNGGARATDYSTSGYVTTYKFGVEYTPINDIRFRGTYSEDIRAPNLYNLFGLSNGHGTTTDPFAGNVNVPSYTITSGNPNLKPEKAHQYEIGLVIQPEEIPGLNISIDYWHINITGAISTVGAVFELQQCYNTRIAGTFTGTSPYCALIQRNPDGSLYSVTTIPFNIASFLASGVDYQLNYHKQLAALVSSWKGGVDFTLSATNTQHNITNTGVPGPAEILDATGTSNVPRWALFGTFAYNLDAWRFAWTERYDSSVLGSAATTGGNTLIYCPTNCPTTVPSGFNTVGWYPRVPTYFLAGIAIDYRFMENGNQEASAFINVNNLFDKTPPWASVPPGQLFSPATNTTLYDTMGVYVRAGVRFRL